MAEEKAEKENKQAPKVEREERKSLSYSHYYTYDFWIT